MDAGWELYPLGGVRRAREAAAAEVQAETADLSNALVSLTAEVGLNYVDLRTYQTRLAVAGANLSSQQQTYERVQGRYRIGLSNQTTLQQARYNLESTRSRIPTLITDGAAALNQLTVLTGQTPGRLHGMLKAKVLQPKASLASAKAKVLSAQATLEEDETDLSTAVIVSPVNGIVLSRDVDPCQTMAASLQAPVLFTLAEDLARMELIVDVDEADVGAVKAGQAAEFTVDASGPPLPGPHHPGALWGAKTVEGVVTYAVVLNVDNADLTLCPGMTATADITVHQVADALLLPNAALRFTPPEDARTRTKSIRDRRCRCHQQPNHRGRGRGASRQFEHPGDLWGQQLVHVDHRQHQCLPHGAQLAAGGGAWLLDIPFILNTGIAFIAFLFSAEVGIVFGYFPARQAARLNPIDALRHE